MLIPILVLCLAVASSLGLIYLWYRVFKQRTGSGLPVCGQCGYAVRGLGGLVCPECGADLREVGIVTPGRSGRVIPIVFIIAWTLLLPGPACLITAPIVAFVPNQQQIQSDNESFSPSIGGEYQSVTLSASGQLPFQEISVAFVANNGTIDSIKVDAVNLQYKYVHGGVSSWQTFDPSAVLTCLKGIGADVKKQHVQDEADELFILIQNWQGINGPNMNLTSRHLSSNGGSSSTMTGPPPMLGVLMFVVWLCVWIGGFFLFFRIRPWSVVQAVARTFS